MKRFMGNINSIESYQSNYNTVVTIGTFDGVHIGHQKIIKRLINTGKANNLKSVILTFFPHPRMVLQKDTKIKLINSIDEKYKLLEERGINHLVVKDFTQDFSRLSAQEFVRELLVEKLKKNDLLITSDTIVWHKNRSLGKPKNRDEAFEMIKSLENSSHEVITSICISTIKSQVIVNEKTLVFFDKIDKNDFFFLFFF